MTAPMTADSDTTPRPTERRWGTILLNAALVLAIAALLIATWMPAIYDRLGQKQAETQPSQ